MNMPFCHYYSVIHAQKSIGMVLKGSESENDHKT